MNQLAATLAMILNLCIVVAVIAALLNFLRADMLPFMTYDRQMFVFGLAIGTVLANIIRAIPRSM